MPIPSHDTRDAPRDGGPFCPAARRPATATQPPAAAALAASQTPPGSAARLTTTDDRSAPGVGVGAVNPFGSLDEALRMLLFEHETMRAVVHLEADLGALADWQGGGARVGGHGVQRTVFLLSWVAVPLHSC